METKTLTGLEVKDADAGVVEGVFATFDVIDKDGDVTVPGAFTEGAAVVISAFNHKSWDGALPVGRGTIHETDDGATFKAHFFMDTSHGRDAFLTVKELADAGLGEWSYSLHNVKADRDQEWNGQMARRVIKSVDVREVSPVLAGAGVNTRTLSAKSEAPQGARFGEHVAAVMTAVVELTDRAAEVVTLRAQDGKAISEDSAALLKSVHDAMGNLAAVIEGEPNHTPETQPEATHKEAATAEFLRFMDGKNKESHR